MKKIIVTFTVIVFAITGKVTAQTGGMHVAAGDLNFSAGKMKEGANTLTKVGAGTLQFVKKGNIFSDVVFKDEAGKTTRLIPTPAGTGGAPNTGSKTAVQESCFGTANKSMGLCVTKSGNVYSITFGGSGAHTWVARYQ